MANPYAKTRKPDNPYEIWESANGQWKWHVLKKYKSPESEAKDPYARWFCMVYSPICPEGELGDVYAQEIKSLAKRTFAAALANPRRKKAKVVIYNNAGIINYWAVYRDPRYGIVRAYPRESGRVHDILLNYLKGAGAQAKDDDIFWADETHYRILFIHPDPKYIIKSMAVDLAPGIRVGLGYGDWIGFYGSDDRAVVVANAEDVSRLAGK